MPKNYFLRGMIFLILAQAMVGFNIVVAKLLISSISIPLLLFIRFTIATLLLLTLHWLTPARKISLREHFSKVTRTDWLFIIAQALTAGVLFNCLMLFGLHYTDANVAGIISSALPAIIALICWIALNEKISAKKSLCILLATAGLLLIAYDKFHGIGTSHSFFGDSIVLLSLLPEAAYYVLCKFHANRLPLFLISALLNGINALLLLAVMMFFHWNLPEITSESWLILLVLGLSSSLFYVFWFLGCQHVDGLMISLSTAVMPVSTVVIAWIILGEQLTRLQSAGMGFVMLSILAYARR